MATTGAVLRSLPGTDQRVREDLIPEHLAAEVNLQGGRLEVKAEHSDSSESGKRNYLRRESSTASYYRVFQLPETVDADNARARLPALNEPLTSLCATYLLRPASGADSAADPVQRFHLNNGAKLERINWLADGSKKALRESLGLMVNYLYEPQAIEANHEKFVRGEIVASRRVRALVLDAM